MVAGPSKQGHQWDCTGNEFKRQFGDSEAAFYPASIQGLGDMFLHLAFRAPTAAMLGERVIGAWAIIRRRHPLLMCRVSYDATTKTPYFTFVPPTLPSDALIEAQISTSFNNKSKDELIFEHMNGPRTLSDEHLSHLVISTPTTAVDKEYHEYDLLMSAPHFLGDGTSLHQATHDLLSLLASDLTNPQIEEELSNEVEWMDVLPPAFETRMEVSTGRFSQIACKVDFIKTLGNEIGGHTLSRNQHGPQKTVIHETAFSEEETAQILKKCKSKNVTVNHALVALCNLVWTRNIRDPKLKEYPLMMYTAINLRPYLSTQHPTNTYWFVSLTYFNIVLPAFLPETQEVFWYRAVRVKDQIRKVVQSPFLKSRAVEMAKIRSARSRGETIQMPTLAAEKSNLSLPPAPSAALLGLSLIGNLDVTYNRSSYPSFHLHSVTTASRQKAGGLLLLEHTFAKKLWLHLCWDENGFEEGHIEKLWTDLRDAVHEFLVSA
ncbi:hypothetical protein GALMADRAFT_271467 [Galerina marginata CBS 339.88]|uniref:Condensation domain-containing protein n=1 Tax=Galerina marginata (strain CBS 339.88) TaxID=685588 RepID=A0A067SVA8_GALM3|nr:hypothetical protein GALMADRAFT_271467 [Galerina marginata CBS 339.88]